MYEYTDVTSMSHRSYISHQIETELVSTGACLAVDYYEGDCQLDPNDAGLSWDAVSFAFLLIMSRVYKTWYFQHVRTDLEIDSELAAR